MKNWIIFLLMVCSVAFAVTNPIPISKLPQLVEKPTLFKPDIYLTDSEVSLGHLVNQWEWDFTTRSFIPDLILSKTKNGKGWMLELRHSSYKIDNLAKNKILLYTLKDFSAKQTIKTYQINFGKYKNVYLRQVIFKNNSSSIDIQNREFIKYEAESSEFKKGERDDMVTHNIYGYLFFKSKFCSMNDSFNSAKCKI